MTQEEILKDVRSFLNPLTFGIEHIHIGDVVYVTESMRPPAIRVTFVGDNKEDLLVMEVIAFPTLEYRFNPLVPNPLYLTKKATNNLAVISLIGNVSDSLASDKSILTKYLSKAINDLGKQANVQEVRKFSEYEKVNEEATPEQDVPIDRMVVTKEFDDEEGENVYQLKIFADDTFLYANLHRPE